MVSDPVTVFHILQSLDTFKRSLKQAGPLSGRPLAGGHKTSASFLHETLLAFPHQGNLKVSVTMFSKQIEIMELLVYLKDRNKRCPALAVHDLLWYLLGGRKCFNFNLI